jgi:hypothetical protein
MLQNVENIQEDIYHKTDELLGRNLNTKSLVLYEWEHFEEDSIFSKLAVEGNEARKKYFWWDVLKVDAAASVGVAAGLSVPDKNRRGL